MARGSALPFLRQRVGPLASVTAARLTAAVMASPGGATLPLAFLLMSSVLPIVKVLLIAAMGLISALPFFDVLNKESRHSLSKLVVTIFLPAIIFVNLGEAITLERLLQWWFIPANVIIASVTGCCLGMLVAWITDCPPQYFRIVFVLTGIGNMGNMPLVLLSAVCSDARNPFGGPEECNKPGTAYIALGMWAAALIMWGIVYNLLAPPEEWLPNFQRAAFEGPAIDRKRLNEPMIPYVEPPEDADDELYDTPQASPAHDGEPYDPLPPYYSEHPPLSSGHSTPPHGHPHPHFSEHFNPPPDDDSMSVGRALALDPDDWSVRQGYMVHRKTGVIRRISKTVQKASVAVLVHVPNRCGEVMKILHVYDILRPPVLAAFLAMIFGMVPPLAYVFFNENGALRFLTDAFAVLGQAMIPCILLVLGANLVNGPGASGLPPRTTLAVVVARLVVVPMLGVCVVLSADRLGFLPPDDKMFRFVLLMQHAMPSSIQIGTACSLRGFGEKEVAAILFFQHISAVFSMGCCLFSFFYILYG